MRLALVLPLLVACASEPGDGAVDTDVACCETDDTEVVDTDDTEVVDTDGCPGEPTLRLGTGVLDFVALAPGDPVTMTHGPQGGWHVDTSFQVDGTGQLVMLEWVLRVTATGAVVTTEDPFQKRVALVPRDPEVGWACAGDYPGERSYLEPAKVEGYPETPPWEALCGVPARFEAAVRGPGSGPTLGPVLATTTLDVVLQPDPEVDGPPCDVVTASAAR